MSLIRILTLLAGGAASAYYVRKKLESMEPQVPAGSDDNVVLYQFEYSPFCAKVRQVLAFKQIPHSIVELTPILHSSYTQRQSGQNKVPYIRHKGQVIADSSAIALYLEEAFPNPPMLPSERAAREQVLLLEDWLDESLQPAVGKLAYLSLFMNPQVVIDDPNITTGIPALDKHKDKIVPLMLGRSVRKNKLTAADLPRLEARVDDVLGRLEAQLRDKEYLVGHQMTLADLTLLGHLSNADRLNIFRSDGPHAWLMAWRDRREAEIGAAEPVTA